MTSDFGTGWSAISIFKPYAESLMCTRSNLCLHVLLNRSNLCLNVLLNCAEKCCSNAVNRRTNINIDEVNFEVTGKHAVILMPEETRHIVLACSFFRSFRKTKQATTISYTYVLDR